MDEISDKFANQPVGNMQNNSDLITRIDERVKSIIIKQDQIDKKLDDTILRQSELLQRIAILETHEEDSDSLYVSIENIQKQFFETDKRLTKIEDDAGTHNERWKSVASFLLQLVWVILAAYCLTKLNLQSPAIP